MKRRFEFVGGSSAKFWQVEVRGSLLNVYYGRLGTEGQQLGKSFDDSAQAVRHAEALIREKLAKGYVETKA